MTTTRALDARGAERGLASGRSDGEALHELFFNFEHDRLVQVSSRR